MGYAGKSHASKVARIKAYKEGPGHKGPGPEQWAAHNAVRTAVKRGILVRPKQCERCGDEPGVDSLGRSKIV